MVRHASGRRIWREVRHRGHRLPLADAGEKQPILFLTWYPGKSLSRVFCVASTRCLYLRRRVKQYHQVVKDRDAKTFEKFSWGHTALVPLPSEWTATAWMSNCYWSGINNDSCNAKVSQMNIHVIIKKISRDVLCICRVSCSEELRTGQKCLRILH